LAGKLGGDSPPPARDQWVGRYEDSRGSGELVVQLRRAGVQVEGIWRLRTGGDGIVTGSVIGGTPVVKFQFASQGGACFALLEGAGEIKDDTWTATYAGRDCQGEISNGRFTLRKR
jgi:hypothetical protein